MLIPFIRKSAAMDQIEIGMQMKPMFVFAAAASRIW